MSYLVTVALFLRNTCKQIKLTSTQKLILIVVAFRIGKNQDTWLKQSELAEECQITSRQLRTDLKILSEKELIIVDKIITKKGKQDRYRLVLESLDYRKWASASVEETTGSGLPIVGGTTGSGLPEGCGSGLPLGTSENVLEVVEIKEEKREIIFVKDTIETNKKTKAQSLVRFDEFWEAYPRKISKEVSRKKWATLKCDKIADEIINNVKARNAGEWKGKEIQFIPHPSTFLNQKRWTDEPEEGSHGIDHQQRPQQHTRAQLSVLNSLDYLSKLRQH